MNWNQLSFLLFGLLSTALNHKNKYQNKKATRHNAEKRKSWSMRCWGHSTHVMLTVAAMFQRLTLQPTPPHSRLVTRTHTFMHRTLAYQPSTKLNSWLNVAHSVYSLPLCGTPSARIGSPALQRSNRFKVATTPTDRWLANRFEAFSDHITHTHTYIYAYMKKNMHTCMQTFIDMCTYVW